VTGRYLDRLNYLVEEGIFTNRGDVFRDSLRRTFRAYGLEPFADKGIVIAVSVPKDVEPS